MENYKKANDTTSSPPSDAYGFTDEKLNEFLNQLPDHLDELNNKIMSSYENPFDPEFDKKTNEILGELETIRSTLWGISQAQIEKSCGIRKFNIIRFNTEFNIAQTRHQIIIKNAYMLGKQRTITANRYIEFKESYNNFKPHMQTVILQNVSNMDFDTNLKNRLYFHCYGMICEVILNLNSVKLKRKNQPKLNQDEIADLFRCFVNITNITCNDYDTSDSIKKLLPRFFEVVNDNVWNENIKNFDEETLKNLKQIRREWIKNESKERSFRKDRVENLDELARKIEGDTKPRQRDLDKYKKPKQPKGKKPKGKRPNKKASTNKRNNPENTQSTQTADRFLTALSKSIRQLEKHQNKNGGQIHGNPCENTKSTKTKNSSLRSFVSFDAKYAKKFLQERWEEVEKNARNNPENPEIVILDSDKSSLQSFTNK